MAKASKTSHNKLAKQATKAAAVTVKKPSATPKKRSVKQASKPAADAVKGLPVSQVTVEDQGKPRKIRAPRRRLLKRVDKRFRIRPKIPSAWHLSKLATKLVADNRKVLAGIVTIYGLLTIVLVRGLNGSTDVSQVKEQFDTLRHGVLGNLASAFDIFGQLLTSSSTTSSDVAGAYQSFLILITSLAVVWVFRQRLNGITVRVRDGFYSGMYPLIPTILVLIVVALQFVPMIIGTWIYSTAINNGIAITGLERFIALLVLIVGIIISVYWLCSSVFALYIVTLPGMTPLKALRSARGLVKYRRWVLLRKLLFLPFVLLLVGSILMVPFILFVPVLAQWVFFLLTMVALAAVHAYMYTLYRELLNE